VDSLALSASRAFLVAAMVLEWIRRKDSRMDKELKDYLFTDKPIAHS
jgi:hypothetical protein